MFIYIPKPSQGSGPEAGPCSRRYGRDLLSLPTYSTVNRKLTSYIPVFLATTKKIGGDLGVSTPPVEVLTPFMGIGIIQ